jgi:nitrile hydratase beta subunit
VNGVHDLGGMHGFGPVVREPDEPVFHHEWERRAFALTLAAGFLGRWNLDMSRFAREQMPPAAYLSASYYERWLWGLEHLLVQTGLLTREQAEAVRRGEPPSRQGGASAADVRVLRAADVPRALQNRRAARLDDGPAPRFKPGDAVVTRNMHPIGHTRLPRYARGRRGVVDRDHGVFIFPDAHAAGLGKRGEHCYSVRFEARELWGEEASPRDAVYIDLFEPYLLPAAEAR